MSEIAQAKSALRKKIMDKRKAVSPDRAAVLNAELEENLLALPEYRTASTLFCYVSVPGEPDTWGLLRDALRCGKRLAVPRCTGKGMMEAVEITSLDQLSKGAYGIMEPAQGEVVPPGELDLAIIPCVACGCDGSRLGHGGGYYDRFCQASPFVRAAVCHSYALLDSVPCEPFDVKMDILVSENGLIRLRGCALGQR